MTTDNIEIEEVIERIINLNESIKVFWLSSMGWAPISAANLLSNSRLDWQVSLSHSLYKWVSTPAKAEEAAVLILGYSNIGSLVEGSLKLFLSVYYEDYKKDSNAIFRKQKLQNPDGITLEQLRIFFRDNIWSKCASDNWDPWIERVQRRRNAIHAFKDRDIGNHSELLSDIRSYLIFLRRINNQLPYPDGYGQPSEFSKSITKMIYETDAPVI